MRGNGCGDARGFCSGAEACVNHGLESSKSREKEKGGGVRIDGLRVTVVTLESTGRISQVASERMLSRRS